MRVGESWLIEPLLTEEEVAGKEPPPSLHKQEHQTIYMKQLFEIISDVNFSFHFFINLILKFNN